MMQSAVLSLLVAFAGYSLLNIAQAGQKIGLAQYATKRAQGMMVWVLATAGTSVAFFVILGAISMGSVSMVGAMAGTGLVSLAVFSRFVMHERLNRKELLSLIVIVAGAAFVGAFTDMERNQGNSEARLQLLWGILIVGSILYSIVWLATRKMRYAGAVIGGFSGFLGAYSQLFQEYGTQATPISAGLGTFIRSLVTNPITLMWVGLSLLSMVVLQFAYRHGRAIEIIPSFVGNFIIVPVVGGVVVFMQNLLVVQWFGVAMIAAGSMILGRGEVEAAAVTKRVDESSPPADKRVRRG